MRRRDFVAALAASLPVLRPRALSERVTGGELVYLMGLVENDPQARKYLSAFREVLSGSGWRDRTKPSN